MRSCPHHSRPCPFCCRHLHSCTVVCLPFPLFFIFYQCHSSRFLMSRLWNTSPILLVWDSARLRSFLSCLFQGICIASPPVCIRCFSLITTVISPFLVFLSLCLLLSSFTHLSALHFLFSLFLFTSDKHSLLLFPYLTHLLFVICLLISLCSH